MAHELTTSYLRDSLSLFRYYKKLAERAMEQVADEQLTAALDGEMNSIAIIVKHLAGNMRSRWTDFLNSDGEKPDRKRDTEFENPPATRAALMRLWEEGWACVFTALEPLSDADIERTVVIRGEPHSVMQAINRQIAHYAYHCGQIVFLAKHLQVQAMEGAHGAARQVGRVQSERRGQRNQPALGKGGRRASDLGPGAASGGYPADVPVRRAEGGTPSGQPARCRRYGRDFFLDLGNLCSCSFMSTFRPRKVTPSASRRKRCSKA